MNSKFATRTYIFRIGHGRAGRLWRLSTVTSRWCGSLWHLGSGGGARWRSGFRASGCFACAVQGCFSAPRRTPNICGPFPYLVCGPL